ncbi:MAG: phosphodiester glycosidase family protein [Oscillospiraceae bacterium]|jgi:exopolysaccharide biosynthesis protein|nr:phosphodiester glycosidase family protein [Oscillospiraceae bacterium]
MTALSVTLGGMFAIIMLYSALVFTDMPGLSGLRDAYIETAMTTGSHQWLAEWFFPKSLIDRIMSKQNVNQDVVSDPGKVDVAPGHDNAPGDDDPPPEDGADNSRDRLGNLILVDDREQDIRIVEIKGTGADGMSYSGRLLFVSDPARVVVRFSSLKGTRGDFIADFLEDHNGIAAINGNGFADVDGVGNGGQILGWSIADGASWGVKLTGKASAGFTKNNILVVGQIADPAEFEIRDMVQWGPALIADGKKLVSGSGGWGIHPRTAVGQTADGTVVLVTVDGRQPDHSIGITVGDLADILLGYGVVNAALCDGGSSSVMAYGGEIIGIPSTPRKTTGRYLPNAIIVLRK